MSSIKENIANNITELRKINNMTQLDLANKLNYTDKAISKWERGESTPDIESLYNMAKIFNVSIDDLLSESLNKTEANVKAKDNMIKMMLKMALGVVAIWLIGTAIYVYGIINDYQGNDLWLAFIWPVPASCFLILIISLIKKKTNVIPYASSFTVWTFLIAMFLQWLPKGKNIWIIFIIGVPIQMLIIISYWIKKR